MLETFIEDSLSARFQDEISLSELISLIESRHEEITGDVSDMLLNLTDYLEFKDTMLSFKKVRLENSNSIFVQDF